MKKYYKREFLNRKEGTACIEISCDGEGYSGVKITDCNRQVTLSCSTYNDKEKENTLYKLNKLIDNLTVLRQKIQGDVA